jgi:hypothetical protein
MVYGADAQVLQNIVCVYVCVCVCGCVCICVCVKRTLYRARASL